ncbi:hypothetical protein GN244_ATG03196 [Phytophthora infestans]|uniref:Uncharacterized protein n=1 Tax=Phytophthora infestans TaxID=4787 RepID=A0A833SAR5_PHYIN|nr:hypothetical protein GN244_ATG03196 [Phytophthora infestans]KAF4142868.1 hypothetical protein GN958_ATG07931 [Phytophthora infestans]
MPYVSSLSSIIFRADAACTPERRPSSPTSGPTDPWHCDHQRCGEHLCDSISIVSIVDEYDGATFRANFATACTESTLVTGTADTDSVGNFYYSYGLVSVVSIAVKYGSAAFRASFATTYIGSTLVTGTADTDSVGNNYTSYGLVLVVSIADKYGSAAFRANFAPTCIECTLVTPPTVW